MRTHYIRHSDGMAVTDEEALDRGTLRPGYRMSVGLTMSDAARAAGVSLADAGFVQHLPAHLLPHLTRLADDARSNEVFRAQAAANTARRMADEITRTQSAGPASAQAARYVTSIADRAQARAVALGGNPALTTHSTKDHAMNINDSIQRLPHGLHSKVHYVLADMRGDSRTVVENGIRNAQSVLWTLQQAQTGAPSPMMGDAAMIADAAPAISEVVQHLNDAITKAQDRASNLNR
jgi:hypothetical protein